MNYDPLVFPIHYKENKTYYYIRLRKYHLNVIM